MEIGSAAQLLLKKISEKSIISKDKLRFKNQQKVLHQLVGIYPIVKDIFETIRWLSCL